MACLDIPPKVKGKWLYLILPTNRNEARCLVGFFGCEAGISCGWECFSGPFTELHERLLVLTGALSTMGLCSKSDCAAGSPAICTPQSGRLYCICIIGVRKRCCLELMASPYGRITMLTLRVLDQGHVICNWEFYINHPKNKTNPTASRVLLDPEGNTTPWES